MQANKKFDNKFAENSRSQIVFRTDIFEKLALGVPVSVLPLHRLMKRVTGVKQ